MWLTASRARRMVNRSHNWFARWLNTQRWIRETNSWIRQAAYEGLFHVSRTLPWSGEYNTNSIRNYYTRRGFSVLVVYSKGGITSERLSLDWSGDDY